MTPVNVTPAKTQKCNEPECKKAPNGFKTNSGLTRPMKKFHEVIVDALSPITSTARVLFDCQVAPETPSVQGNSKGQINYPSVLTEGRHHCGKCEEQFSTRDKVLKHMDNKHDEAMTDQQNVKAANNDQVNDNEQGGFDDDDTDEELEVVEIMEDLEDEAVATGLENRVAAEKIVDTFVEMAYRELHSTELTPKLNCHECVCKEKNLVKLDRLLSEKDAMIEEKSATIRGMKETLRKNAKVRADMQKKVDQTDKVKRKLVMKQKEVANLKNQIQTKNNVEEVESGIDSTEDNNATPQEVIMDLIVKKCKKCNFTAPNMDVLGLHMENDHQYEFPCSDCNKKFPFKNQLKI